MPQEFAIRFDENSDDLERVWMQEWTQLGRESLFQNPVLGLVTESIRTQSGHETDWTVVEIGDGVAVLPVDDDGNVHLIYQYRHAVKERVWELPAGRVEPSESNVNAGRRELAEEAGLGASKMQALGFIWPLDGVCRHRVHLYIARGLTRCNTAHETFESMESRLFTPIELHAMVMNGQLRCGIALAALARAGFPWSEDSP